MYIAAALVNDSNDTVFVSYKSYKNLITLIYLIYLCYCQTYNSQHKWNRPCSNVKDGFVWFESLPGTPKCPEGEVPGVSEDNKPCDPSDHEVIHQYKYNSTSEVFP